MQPFMDLPLVTPMTPDRQEFERLIKLLDNEDIKLVNDLMTSLLLARAASK